MIFQSLDATPFVPSDAAAVQPEPNGNADVTDAKLCVVATVPPAPEGMASVSWIELPLALVPVTTSVRAAASLPYVSSTWRGTTGTAPVSVRGTLLTGVAEAA
jgi:hypothetical protein